MVEARDVSSCSLNTFALNAACYCSAASRASLRALAASDSLSRFLCLSEDVPIVLKQIVAGFLIFSLKVMSIIASLLVSERQIEMSFDGETLADLDYCLASLFGWGLASMFSVV